MSIEYTHPYIYTICMHMHIYDMHIYVCDYICIQGREESAPNLKVAAPADLHLGEIPSGPGSAYTAQISEDKRMSLAVITKVLEGSWKST